MTTTTLTLTGFLLARIAEDEAVAQHAAKGLAVLDATGMQVMGATVYTPARVLAECEAKRKIVEMMLYPLFTDEGVPFGEGGFGEAYAEALAHLAVVYADHPDYREAWRP